MGRMRGLARFFTELTPHVRPANYRTFVVLNVGTVVAAALHIGVVALAVGVGSDLLAAANAVSISTYGAALLLNRRGRHLASVVIALFELSLHQALAVHELGWASGFPYYLLTITGIVFFLPPGRLAAKTALLAGAALVYVGLLSWSRTHPPALAIDPTTLAWIHNVNAIAVFGVLGFFAYFYSRAAEIAETRLEAARRKSEELLHNILPAAIAERLSDRRETIADGFPQATVLFADIVGFTALAGTVPPDALVALLDRIFSTFDDLVDARGLEKIKTIGDAYMVAAGVPERRADHAEAIAELALDMQRAVAGMKGIDGGGVTMRIGISTGPVVAGVIGKRKFVYDLWGDSVNTAARMESHGIPGEIQVSEAAKDALAGRYELVERGSIDVKGKGAMRTWLLKGRRG